MEQLSQSLAEISGGNAIMMLRTVKEQKLDDRGGYVRLEVDIENQHCFVTRHTTNTGTITTTDLGTDHPRSIALFRALCEVRDTYEDIEDLIYEYELKTATK